MYYVGFNTKDVPSSFLRAGLTSAIATELLGECVHCLDSTHDNEFCLAAMVADMFIRALPTKRELHQGLQDLQLAVTERRKVMHETEKGDVKNRPAIFANEIAFPKEIEPIRIKTNEI